MRNGRMTSSRRYHISIDGFVKETQRLHSPSFQPARNARQDVILPGGYRLPAGAILIPSLPHLHTDPDYWDDPYRFDPDRWATIRVKERLRFAYVPFAAGARGCIGFNAALLEAKVDVVEWVYRYVFVDASEEAMEYDLEFNNIRPMNFYATVVKRTEGSRSAEVVKKTEGSRSAEVVVEAKPGLMGGKAVQ